jgi:hypothetical protein
LYGTAVTNISCKIPIACAVSLASFYKLHAGRMPRVHSAKYIIIIIFRYTVVVLSTLIKKKKLIFLIYKEIQSGAVAKSYMTNGILMYGEIFAYFLIY